LFALCLILLLSDPHFDRSELYQFKLFHGWQRLIGRFIIFSALIFLFVLYFMPERLFSFVHTRPKLWIAVMILYPIISVYPQELIYRSFFFHRYRDLMPLPALIIVNILCFSLMHSIFHNWVAVIFTLIGGALFVSTYLRSQSLITVTVEHALYGNWIFTVGAGIFFFNSNSWR
jgi:membrane protease YdiL (CAAX protease family)